LARIPENAVAAVELFCESRVPEELRDEIRLECSTRGNSITIAECRPPWNPELMGPEWTSVKCAQLRFDEGPSTWTLCCRASDERWYEYDGVAPSTSVDPLLAEIDADPTGIFWG
jgi:hypothetical protein